jgi:hypothetical protein
MSLEDLVTPILRDVADGTVEPDDYTAFRICMILEQAITGRRPITNTLYFTGAILAAVSGAALVWGMLP